MSGYETIEVTTTDHVMTLTLNRPDVLNAFNDAFSTEMSDATKSCERDSDVRVLVITGSGRAFSSGQDLEDLKKKYVPGHVPELGEDLRRRYDPDHQADPLDAETRHRLRQRRGSRRRLQLGAGMRLGESLRNTPPSSRYS